MLILKLYCLGFLCLAYYMLKNKGVISATSTEEEVIAGVLACFIWPILLVFACIIYLVPFLIKERKWFWQA